MLQSRHGVEHGCPGHMEPCFTGQDRFTSLCQLFISEPLHRQPLSPRSGVKPNYQTGARHCKHADSTHASRITQA